MPTDFWGGIIWSVAPTVVIGLIFWFIMRSVIRSDRNERKAYSKIEAEERARFVANSAVEPGSAAAGPKAVPPLT
jgi:flagellar biosynthesis/type III secretory pathway M-ring protein FliF/YscJ